MSEQAVWEHLQKIHWRSEAMRLETMEEYITGGWNTHHETIAVLHDRFHSYQGPETRDHKHEGLQ